MNKIVKTLYRVVGGVVIFIVGSIAYRVTAETVPVLIPSFVLIGMLIVFLKFTGLWNWLFVKRKNKHQKGSIQISILAVIVFGVVIIGGFGYNEYKNFQNEKIENEKLLRKQQDKQIQEITIAQQKELEETKQEIEKLKSENQEDSKKIEELEQKQKDEELKAIGENYQPLSATTWYFATHIVKIICSDDDSQVVKNGSGTVFGLNRFIITNYHVVKDTTQCVIGITDDIKKPPSRWYDATVASSVPSLDIATLRPTLPLPDDVIRVGSDFICSTDDIELGDEVIIIGYPTVGGSTITVTEGIVSGFDGFLVKTSAKMEFGNSGGGAFLQKPKTPVRGIMSCWFGIPTFVTQGQLESIGSIINYSLIHEQANQ
ncbi:trypsin-like peptidase domain-containing protein [Candidatus Parcubacteria bacterium]|nr:trypsin-like peptidase domain-containing protein [Candidatus Parcubacteria bacterium]